MTRLCRRLAYFTKNETAQSLVEFAIALPFLTWVLLGTIDFARLYYLQAAVINAANTGAQFALDSRRTPDQVRAIIVQEAAPVIDIAPGTSITFTATPSWAAGNSLQVDVVQDFRALTPFMSGLWGGGTLTVRGTAVVRFNP